VSSPQTIPAIWGQGQVPVVYRSAEAGPLMVRLPYRRDNYDWLRGDRTRKPKWDPDKKYWTLPRAWFKDLVSRLLPRYGAVYVIQPHRPMEKCARACWDATGLECSCSCLGVNHGTGHPGGRWYEVTESLAVRWHERELYWSLLSPA
jgi:hypothetical protein